MPRCHLSTSKVATTIYIKLTFSAIPAPKGSSFHNINLQGPRSLVAFRILVDIILQCSMAVMGKYRDELPDVTDF